ncbi:MAG TPA: hypothetical protein VG897_17720 [Terriglobales bacterium]|nr:hypothetical protein [Terriglobales bacterium]
MARRNNLFLVTAAQPPLIDRKFFEIHFFTALKAHFSAQFAPIFHLKEREMQFKACH